MNKKLLTNLIISTSVLSMVGCGSNDSAIDSKVSLGEKLFNDVSLSRDGTQSCATCHDINHAFIDPRINKTSADSQTPGAVSLGQDDIALGDRNTPSAAYMAFVPEFHFDDAEGLFVGGQFLDGRASNLVEQAKQPFLNEVEMQTTKEDVVAKVQEKYRASFEALYGADIFDDTERAFNAVADSIAEFEKTDVFAPFDSKFDRVLRGETTFTDTEQRGHDLFVAEDKANCAACHPVPDINSSKQDSLFTDFTYDNLGVPKNTVVRANNGKGMSFIDNGLFDNEAVDDTELKGAFRVSSLRNIAVTGPYMHNGAFKNLSTVVHFYNSRDVAGALNPETNAPWETSEVDATKNTEELGDLGLTDQEINDIVAFMRTLTDERYEHLMP